MASGGTGGDDAVVLLAFAVYVVTAVGYFCLLLGTVWLIFS